MNAIAALAELLRRRLDLVGRLSQATSQLQRFRQAQMAAEMDAQRCEMMGGSAETAQELQRELFEARCCADEAESSVARCEALIVEIEASLAETDAEIEAARR